MKYAIYGQGDATSAYEPRTARAFCDGRKAQAIGTLIGANPFSETTDKENKLAWDFGHASGTNGDPDGFCAPADIATVPDIDGLTEEEANAAITAAKMTVGTVTGTTGVVISQSIVAGTDVASRTPLDYSLTA